MAKRPQKKCKKSAKYQNSKKTPSSSRKINRKGENPVRIPPTDKSLEYANSNTRTCKNIECQAELSDRAFCKRCSCFICHLFDDIKDPSLWLVCPSEAGGVDYCGLSCHIECALKHKKVGVVNIGQPEELDGSYCCFECGTVSSILGYWKKQLIIAKKTQWVAYLCERIFLCFRLLDGTSRFKELHKIVEDAKDKLESEVGPLDKDSAKHGGLVSRLSVASEVLELCALAVDKAEEWLTTVSNSHPSRRGINLENGYEREDVVQPVEPPRDQPVLHVLPVEPRRDQPVEPRRDQAAPFPQELDLDVAPVPDLNEEFIPPFESPRNENNRCAVEQAVVRDDNASSHETDKRGLARSNGSGNSKDLAIVEVQAVNSSEDVVQPVEPPRDHPVLPVEPRRDQPVEPRRDQAAPFPQELDLNVAPVPDLNEEFIPPFESPRNENNRCAMEQAVVRDDNALSHETDKRGLARSNGSGNSRDLAIVEVQAVTSSEDVVQPVEPPRDQPVLPVEPRRDQPVEPCRDQPAPFPQELDLNVAPVPDLNEEFIPPFESPRNENNRCTMEQAVVTDDNALSHETDKRGLGRSNGSGNSRDLAIVEVQAVNSSEDVVQPVEPRRDQPVEPRRDQAAPFPQELDLNVARVPDLNEEFIPPFESPRNENNRCAMEQAVVRDDNALSHETVKRGLARSKGSGISRDLAIVEVQAVNSSEENFRKRTASAQLVDTFSDLVLNKRSKIVSES